MKKNLFMAFGIIALMSLAACEKDPDMGQLDSDLVVYTDHDNSVDFSKYVTYYLPDSILEAGDIHASYWTDNNALQLSYVSQTNTVISGGYWGGWWDPFYWGAGWGGWYYPYPVSYSYDTQALILEMVDLTGQDADNNQRQIPVVWYASASGFQFGSNRVNMQLLLDGVDQAFSQSAYLSTNK